MQDIEVLERTLAPAVQAHTAPAKHASRQGQSELLSFRLGAEEYAVDLLCVQEIRSFQQPTHIAGAADQVLGVLNLRGTIVPIVDLRLAVGIPQPGFDALTVVVVLNVQDRVFGAVVDAVCDVVEIQPAQLRELPPLSGEGMGDLACGLAVVDTRMLILLAAEQLPRLLLGLASPARGD
jgi:purine-binding chemotaxis protein CheW